VELVGGTWSQGDPICSPSQQEHQVHWTRRQPYIDRNTAIDREYPENWGIRVEGSET
jgi:hypothetical protein